MDLVGESMRVLNKLRPLVADGGRLVSINNALFLSGADLMSGLDELCKDGYVSIEAIIPIPDDITGYPETVITPPPCDPAPFNHPTKNHDIACKEKKVIVCGYFIPTWEYLFGVFI